MFNGNSYKEKHGYENQIEREGWLDVTEPQPDSLSWPQGQDERESWHHCRLTMARPRSTRNRGRNSKAGYKRPALSCPFGSRDTVGEFSLSRVSSLNSIG